MPILLILMFAALAGALLLAAVGIVGVVRHHAWGPIILGLAAIVGVFCALALAVMFRGTNLI